jgi:hypothetical protein
MGAECSVHEILYETFEDLRRRSGSGNMDAGGIIILK